METLPWETSMHRLSIIAAALSLALLPTFAGASPDAWALADEAYESQHYGEALDLYSKLAAGGDARAAEVAGHMLVVGETLYGNAVRRDPERAARLLEQAAAAGRPVATYLLRRTTVASGESARRP